MARDIIKKMLECGVHFGHQTKKWNPKMKPFVFGKRRNIFIIDLEKTLEKLNEAKNFLSSVVAKGGSLLLVGTKKHARDIVAEEAARANVFYINNRWLGGTLTNFPTLRESIRKMKELEALIFGEGNEFLKKKERSKFMRLYNKKLKNFAGIKDMEKLPDVLIIIDTEYEQNAVREAKRLGIKTIGIVDTNCDPNDVDYPIPANDDALRSIRLILGELIDTVLESRSSVTTAPVQEDEESGEEPADGKELAEKAKKLAEEVAVAADEIVTDEDIQGEE